MMMEKDDLLTCWLSPQVKSWVDDWANRGSRRRRSFLYYTFCLAFLANAGRNENRHIRVWEAGARTMISSSSLPSPSNGQIWLRGIGVAFLLLPSLWAMMSFMRWSSSRLDPLTAKEESFEIEGLSHSDNDSWLIVFRILSIIIGIVTMSQSTPRFCDDIK